MDELTALLEELQSLSYVAVGRIEDVIQRNSAFSTFGEVEGVLSVRHIMGRSLALGFETFD